ncbi:response regulator transcription factor [Paenibacillus glufosinatiresistens]|uniref:response regulator transcription factor n=1 Tax=Paenibacillus glufosinatiresistens TaxID=3070657 RepID=UPI00286E8428|nr:response regulator [Paenibacillus sp. YX.27]
MRKVLFADDEPMMLEGLRLMIDWERFGFQICGEALDGEDALLLMEERKPELVITDVRMPVIDGLELIREASERRLGAEFIILSGYADFQYARQAMEYGICNYLTKPLDEAELENAVAGVAAKIRQREEERNQQLLMEERVRSEALVRLLLGEGSPVPAAGREESLALLPELGRFRCVLVDGGSGPGGGPPLRDRLAALAQEHPWPEAELMPFAVGPGRCGFLLASGSPRHPLPSGLVEAAAGMIAERFLPGARLYASREHEGLPSAALAYQEAAAVRNLDSASATETASERILYYDNRLPADAPLPAEAMNRLQQAVLEGDREEVVLQNRRLFHLLRANGVSAAWTAACLATFKLKLLRAIERQTGDSSEWEARWFPAAPLPTEQATAEELLETADWFAKRDDKREHALTLAVGDYIREHYREKLQLRQVAEQFHINPAYLGQRFKKRFGLAFNEYLHSVRIEEAKKLLRRTDYAVSDIAGRVGYTVTDHFTEKFKALNGMSPSAYRKGGSGGREG